MLLFFSCQELVNNDQQRALTSDAPQGILQITYAGRELGKSPLCSETDCTQKSSRIQGWLVSSSHCFMAGNRFPFLRAGTLVFVVLRGAGS